MSNRKLLLLETAFLFSYFMCLPLLSTLQYYSRYKGQQESLQEQLIYYLTTGFLGAWFYLLYYKIALPYFLYKRKYIYFAFAVLVFIALNDVWLVFLDWFVYHIPYLKMDIRKYGGINGKLFPRQMFSVTLERLVVLTSLGVFIKAFKDEVNIRRLKEKHLQLELNYLKAQLHPHFFFNTLNNIYSLALEKSDHTAPTVVKLSELMRYIIYDCATEKVPLQKEVQFIKNYIELEQIRHNEETVINFNLQGNAKGKTIEPLLFIALVENAFKHGINTSHTGAWMDISLIIFEREVVLEIKNSKHVQLNKKEDGVGLQNIRKRLELLYPGQHSFTINNNEHSFEVFLNLQLHEQIQVPDRRRRAVSAENN